MKTFKDLVPVSEIVNLTKYTKMKIFNKCIEIEENIRPDDIDEYDNLWDWGVMLATIWNAGRIQGVREERLKKKRKSHK